MAEIRKEIKLVASLDDEQLKRQIRDLKKELSEGVSLSTQDLSSLKSALSSVAEQFSNDMKKAIEDVKKSGVTKSIQKEAEDASISLAKKEERDRAKKAREEAEILRKKDIENRRLARELERDERRKARDEKSELRRREMENRRAIRESEQKERKDRRNEEIALRKKEQETNNFTRQKKRDEDSAWKQREKESLARKKMEEDLSWRAKDRADKEESKELRKLDKEIKAQLDSEEKIENKRINALEKEESIRKRIEERRARALEAEEQIRKEMARLDETMTAKVLRGMGMHEAHARQFVSVMEGAREGRRPLGPIMQTVAAGVGMAAGALRTPLGTAALAGYGMQQAAVFARQRLEFIRDIRSLGAQERFENVQSILQGQALRGQIIRGARRDVSTSLTGGISSSVEDFFGGLGNITRGNIGTGMNQIRSVITGESFERGRLRQTGAEAETRIREVEPVLQAVGRARELRQPMLGAMRGGFVSGQQLRGLMRQGAMNAISQEETLQQFLEARQSLGNIGARQNLGRMQNIFQRTGVGVGEQAQIAELIFGVGRDAMPRGGIAGGITKTTEILKKAIAAGMDASKAGQFLRSTAEFVAQTAGLGQVDVDRMADMMARFAAAGARGGMVTQQDVARARSLQEQLSREAVTREGFAGIGNWILAQQISGMSRGGIAQTLAFTGIGIEATREDIEEIARRTGSTSEQAKQQAQAFLDARNREDALKRGMRATGLDAARGLGFALMGEETGMRTEQALGRIRMQEGAVLGLPAPGALPPSAALTVEGRSLQADFMANQLELSTGFENLVTHSNSVSDSLKELSTTLDQANEKIKSLIPPAIIQGNR